MIMRYTVILCSLLLTFSTAPVTLARQGWSRWDHHPTRRTLTRPTSTTPAPVRHERPVQHNNNNNRGGSRSWDHRIGWSVPPERCQISGDLRHVTGHQLDSYYIDYVSELLVQDKTLLSPIVFDGVMVSRTNTYKNLYFVSFKVFRVLKGQIQQQFHGHLRLLFQVESRKKNYKLKGNHNCPPVPFNVRSGKRYIVFVKNLRTPGRFLATAKPELVRRKSTREVKQMVSCKHCVSKPQLKTPKSKKLSSGTDLKMKCKITNKAVPPPAIAWYKDGALLTPATSDIVTRKKRSTLTIKHVGSGDAGVYTCQASNILGTSSDTTEVTIRDSGVQSHQASSCPIHSYCLNGGTCLYYQSIGELVCRCSEGFTGQRCQFKKAMKFQSPGIAGCGAYGYDINQLCSAWREAPQEMTKEQYQEWKLIQDLEMSLKRNKTAPNYP